MRDLARRVLLPIGAGLLLFISLGAWAVSSPVSASPDDDFHAASIWCGAGEREGLCELGATDDSRFVPAPILETPCYAFKPGTTPACQTPDLYEEGFALVETDRVNAGTQYPSGFYFIASFFAGDNIVVSTLLIRLVNVGLFSILAVLAWVLLPARLRPAFALATLLTMIPVGAFVVASINPSSWAITSGALLLPTLLGYFASQGGRKIALGTIAFIAAAIGFSARGDSAAYAIVAVLAAGVLSFRANRQYWLTLILPAVILLGAVFAFLGAGQTELALAGEVGGTSQGTPLSASRLLETLFSLPTVWNGVFGLGYGLGWMDTGLPALVPGIMIFFAAGTLFLALRRLDLRKLLALSGVAFVTVMVPLYMVIQSGETILRSGVQPRYILPLITMLIATALAPTAGALPASRGTTLSWVQLWLLAAGFPIAYTLSLFSNLRRYTTGSLGTYNINAGEWWWPAGPSPFAILIIGSLAFAAFMAAFALASSRPTATVRDEPPASRAVATAPGAA